MQLILEKFLQYKDFFCVFLQDMVQYMLGLYYIR